LNLIYSLEQRKGEFSEGFMIEGDHRQVIRIFPSPFEYWLSTSDAGDNRYLQSLRENGCLSLKRLKRLLELIQMELLKEKWNRRSHEYEEKDRTIILCFHFDYPEPAKADYSVETLQFLFRF
jgi:hypothetical protein